MGIILPLRPAMSWCVGEVALGRWVPWILMIKTWNSIQPVFYGCFNLMIPNHCINNGCFTKHPLKDGCVGYQEYFHYNNNKDWDTSCPTRMRFCWSPGWLIISFGFFRLSFLEGLQQLQPSSWSWSSSSSSSSHPHSHPFLWATSPIWISCFSSNQKSTPTSNSSCRFFEVQAGIGDVTFAPKQTTKAHGQTWKTPRYFEKKYPYHPCFTMVESVQNHLKNKSKTSILGWRVEQIPKFLEEFQLGANPQSSQVSTEFPPRKPRRCLNPHLPGWRLVLEQLEGMNRDFSRLFYGRKASSCSRDVNEFSKVPWSPPKKTCGTMLFR